MKIVKTERRSLGWQITLNSDGDNNDDDDDDDGDDDSGQYVCVGTVCNWKQSSKQFVFPI